MNRIRFHPLILVLLVGCAGLSKRIPESERYQYSDLKNHKYSILLKKGRISDTSSVADASDVPMEILKWSYDDHGKEKIDTILGNANDKSGPDSCKPDPNTICQRSTKSILKVLRKMTPKLKGTYDAYLRKYRFAGKVTLKFKINPEGDLRSIYLLGNTTGSHEFALDVIKIINTWKFEAIGNGSFDIVTVPFTFSP